MSESLNRKACDRCHAQKLSCKRIGRGTCDRCLRLNAECKSSPSLRYKKQIQHYDQIQEQQQQAPLPPTQNSDQAQHLLQHYHSRELLQQQQPPPRLAYSQGQSITPKNALYSEEQHHSGAEDGTERRSPKRRRKGSDAHPVQRDTVLPLLATDAMMAPGIQSQVMTVPDGSAGLAEYAMNLRNMDYMALSQPMPPNYLLGSQVPSGVDDYFPFQQVNPSFWPNQSHEEVQQLQHHNLVHHHQQQQVFDQVSFAPLIIPDPAAAQQDTFRSVQQPSQQDILDQDCGTLVFGNRRRQSAPPPHQQTSPFPATERRSRSNIVRIDYTDPVILEESDLTGPHVMDQFFEIFARVRVLSNHLECLEQGKDYRDGPDGKSNVFTVAELYKHTLDVIDVLERLVAIKKAPSDSAASGVEPPINATDPSNCMFTVSLYALILNALQRLFDHVRAILARADPKLDDTFDSYLLPTMNFGIAGGTSIGAHPALHMSLTVQVGMQYLGRLRNATVFLGLAQAAETNGNGAHGSAGASGPRVPMASGTEISLSFVNLKSMEGNLSKTLGQLQDELNDFMDAMDVIDATEEKEKKEKK